MFFSFNCSKNEKIDRSFLCSIFPHFYGESFLQVSFKNTRVSIITQNRKPNTDSATNTVRHFRKLQCRRLCTRNRKQKTAEKTKVFYLKPSHKRNYYIACAYGCKTAVHPLHVSIIP